MRRYYEREGFTHERDATGSWTDRAGTRHDWCTSLYWAVVRGTDEVVVNARDAWGELSEPWRACIEEAWASWCAGSAGSAR